MTICINNGDTKNYNNKWHRNGYRALCQDHKYTYGTKSTRSKLETKEEIHKKRIKKREQWIEKNPNLWEVVQEHQDLVCIEKGCENQ